MLKEDSKKVPLDKILNLTKEFNPDDIEVGEREDLQALVEQKDDYNPDDLTPTKSKSRSSR